MKSIISLTLILFLLTVSLSAQISENAEKEAVKETVQKAIDANYNSGNIELIEKFHHPGFNLLIVNNNKLHYISLKRIIKGVENKKAKGEYPPKEKISIKFLSVEVAGYAATTRFDYYKGEKHTCADFMSLYKFKEGWRIVSQTTYHYH